MRISKHLALPARLWWELAEGSRPELAEGSRHELAEGSRPELAEGLTPK